MTDAAPLPQFIRDLLASPPARGGGMNVWFYRASRVLHAFRSPVEIEQLLAAATAGEPVKHGEIERAVVRSAETAWRPGQPTGPLPTAPKWPKCDEARRQEITDSGLGLVDLWETSPERVGGNSGDAEQIIDALFPGDPLLCVGQDNAHFATRPRETLRGELGRLQLIVPSPMTARTGLTQDGKTSEHSLNNTGPRRFLVIEQDAGTADEQSAVLLHLATKAPLVLAVHSGSKSIHGWFMATGQTEDALRAFMRYAVSLGGDPAGWTRSQFMRMPGGTRDNGHRQTVYFLNREVIR